MGCSYGPYYGQSVIDHSGEPMRWVGLYIAAASLVCFIFILADVCNAFRKGQVWFPCRYFSLNAASLTILAVASKFSVDLTTFMPGTIDQLAKLSTSVLISVSMAIFIPTLGAMGDTELVSNFAALVILIITIIVNICIQLYTGVMDASFFVQQIIAGSIAYLLMVCCSTAIALASIKNELRVKYEQRHKLALNEFTSGSNQMKTKRLENYLMKFSMMSHTGWPYMVLGRSRLGSTTAFICTVDTALLFVATYSAVRYDYSIYCHREESDYRWSASLVLSAQILAESAGLMVVSPKLLFNPTPRNVQILSGITNVIKIEGYWTRWLVEIKQRPFFLSIHNKRCRKFVHHVKNHFCNFFIAMQIAMVLMIKLFGSLYDLLVAFPIRALFRLVRNLCNQRSSSPSRVYLTNLRPYILYLEGEEELKESMMKIALKATRRYLELAMKEEPVNLIRFLGTSRGFKGVFEFDSDQVRCLDSQEPPTHCWSLSIVTLTSIAISLPDIDKSLVHNLLISVREGLMFVKQIEESHNNDISSINMRKAADVVWEQVDNHGRRLDVKLTKLATQGNNPIKILNFLVDSAKDNFQTFKPRKEKVSIWPIEAMAANSLYRICQTILLDCQNQYSHIRTANDMFEMLSSRICDILGACLTNLENLIRTKCSQSTIENMNETTQHVLNLFGRTKRIMVQLDGREKPNLSLDHLMFIDEWRRSNNMTDQLL